MTGFGSSVVWVGAARASLTCELRSVNQKNLEIKLRLPPALVAFEGLLTSQLRAAFSRGRLDAFVRIAADDDPTPVLSLDESLARHLLRELRAFGSREGIPGDVALRDLLLRPEIFRVPDADSRPVHLWRPHLEALLQAAVRDLMSSREEEGRGLQADLAHHLRGCAATVDQLAERTASSPLRLRERLEARLADLTLQVAPERLAQEVALLAERIDVSEELARLRLHLAHFRTMMDAAEPVGRKLDFLCQELHREANTVGSKCTDATAAHLVVELKAAVERLREQVQNVE